MPTKDPPATAAAATTTYKDHLRIMPVSDTPDRHTIAVSSAQARRNRDHHQQHRRFNRSLSRSHHIIEPTSDDDLLLTPTNSPHRSGAPMMMHLNPLMTASMPAPSAALRMWQQQQHQQHIAVVESSSASSSSTSALHHHSCRQSLSFSFSAASDASLATTLTEPDDATTAFDAHPSYQNMMDDRLLLDSCSEAQRDIAGTTSASITTAAFTTSSPSSSSSAASANNNSGGGATAALLLFEGRRSTNGSNNTTSTDTNSRVNGSSDDNNNNDTTLRPVAERSAASACRTTADRGVVGSPKNVQRLRQWIDYMQQYLDAIAPRRAEVLRMSTFERRVRLAEQTELREYIASYDRTVKLAAADAVAMGLYDAAAGGGLEQRYLALLLQAIEAQCLLEGYPGMRRLATTHKSQLARRQRDDDEDGDDDGGEGVNVLDDSNEVADEDESVPSGERHVEGCDNDQTDGGPNILAAYNDDAEDEEDAASSVFSFESAERPCTNLRDEILAVVANNSHSNNGGADASVDINANEDVNDRTLVPHEASVNQARLEKRPNSDGSPPISSGNDSAETAHAKLTKDMVNRWLQLNLQPSVSASFWMIHHGRQSSQSPPAIAAKRPPPPAAARSLHQEEDIATAQPRESATSTLFIESVADNNPAGVGNATLRSNTSSSAVSSDISNNSPRCDDPVWDGFVHELRRSSSVERRFVANMPWDYTQFIAIDGLTSEDAADAGERAASGAENPPIAFAMRPEDGNAADGAAAAAGTVRHGSSASLLSATSSLRLNDSFLLSGPTRQLTMSTLKHIDDIFDVQHDAPNRVEWVERKARTFRTSTTPKQLKPAPAPSQPSSPRQAPSGRSQSPQPLPRGGRRVSEVIGQLEASLLRDRERLASIRCHKNDATAGSTSTTAPESEASDAALLLKDKRLRRRCRKKSTSKAPSATLSATCSTSSPSTVLPGTNVSLPELLENNIAAMRPDEVQAIIRLCRTHLECLNHVLLVRTLDTVVGQRTHATNSLVCEQRMAEAAEATAESPVPAVKVVCRCGPIAQLVQRMVNFVRDYVNMVRNWRLYRLIVVTIAELYGMARFVGERVRWHRAQMLRAAAEEDDEAKKEVQASETTIMMVKATTRSKRERNDGTAARRRRSARTTSTTASAVEFVL